MNDLVRYEAARRALAEARRVDEVKNIRDKAVAMQVYAQQAKDRELIEHATEIRMRAEIRAGELLREMAERGERDRGKGGDRKSRSSQPTVKIADLGVTKDQSSRWQKLAALPKEQQEERIASAKCKAEEAVEKAKPNKKPRASKAPKPARKAIGPVDRCTMSVRATVLEIMRELVPSEFAELFAALRDELDDLEKVAERRRHDGHHAARQPS